MGALLESLSDDALCDEMFDLFLLHIGLTLRHIELCNIASSVAYREICQNFSNSVDYTYGQLTVDSVA